MPKGHLKHTGLPFPFITGAYVNKSSCRKYKQKMKASYHSLLSRVLMSTDVANRFYQYDKRTVTIPFYHGCLCQLIQSDIIQLEDEIKLPFPFITGAYVNNVQKDRLTVHELLSSYHSLLSRVLMST